LHGRGDGLAKIGGAGGVEILAVAEVRPFPELGLQRLVFHREADDVDADVDVLGGE
jgi:hypothetical protein